MVFLLEACESGCESSSHQKDIGDDDALFSIVSQSDYEEDVDDDPTADAS